MELGGAWLWPLPWPSCLRLGECSAAPLPQRSISSSDLLCVENKTISVNTHAVKSFAFDHARRFSLIQIDKPTEAKQTHRPDTKESARTQTNCGAGRHLALALTIAVMPSPSRVLCSTSACTIPIFKRPALCRKRTAELELGGTWLWPAAWPSRANLTISISSMHWS